jgi:hypothetical protein
MKKILICTPTSEVKDYCFNEFSYQLKHLLYPVDVLFVDNSKNPKYHLKIKEKGFNVIYSPAIGNETIHHTMCRCNNICRDYMLIKDYDYMFSLESDVFIPENTIEHLLSFRKQIVGLGYFIGHICESKFLSFEMEDLGNDVLIQIYSPDNAFMNLFDGSLRKVYQPGIGCMLISRAIVEKFPFRIGTETDGHADSFFYIDLQKAGIPVYISTSALAHHKNGNWRKILNIK